jgi:hypothetical protein
MEKLINVIYVCGGGETRGGYETIYPCSLCIKI